MSGLFETMGGWPPWVNALLFLVMLLVALTVFLCLALAWRGRRTGVCNPRSPRQQAALSSLANSAAIARGDVFTASREITEHAAMALDADAVSVWTYDEASREFRLEDRYTGSDRMHGSGQRIAVGNVPRFLEWLQQGQAVVVSPRDSAVWTSESAPLMGPADTATAIIAPFRVYRKLLGFLAVSRIRRRGSWAGDEIHFAGEVTDPLAFLFVTEDRRRSEEALSRERAELEVRVQERTAELSRRNETLKGEIDERNRAEDERRRLETQIQQVQKLESLGIMAGGVAHDFNNILMAILGNVEMAKLEMPEDSPLGVYLDDIDVAARRAATLSRQMLAFSGRGHAIIQAIDLNRLVKDMMRILEPSILGNVPIHYDLEEDLPVVDGDPSQIGQVLMNLVINGVEALEQGSGLVMVRTGTIWCDSDMFADMWMKERLPEGRYVFLEVIDSGCGMTPETLSRMFDPFFTTKFTGRGLGLAAVLGIVKGHHGAIDVCSEVGKGSTLRVLLPTGRLVPPSPAEAPAAKTVPTGGGTILLVDDELPIRTLGKRMLERLGFNVLLAEDGRKAVTLFRDHREEIRCVLLDLMMPSLGGRETLQELRTIDSKVKVIMCSGFTEDDVAAKFQDWNLAGILPKPYALETLSTRIQAALQVQEGCRV